MGGDRVRAQRGAEKGHVVAWDDVGREQLARPGNVAPEVEGEAGVWEAVRQN